MNKTGQVMIYGIMVFVFTFLVALAVSRPLVEIIGEARDTLHLDCDNVSISTGQRTSCIIVDITLPYFIATVIIGGASYIVMSRSGG